MRSLFPLLFLVFVMLWSCKTEEEPEPTPDSGAKKCYITRVRVTSFPTTDNGSDWDVDFGDGQKADLTFEISNSTEVIYEHESYFSDVKLEDLPVVFSVDDFLCPTLNEEYGVLLYDHDGFTSGDDFVGGDFFNPNDYKMDRPDSIIISTVDVQMDVFLKWED